MKEKETESLAGGEAHVLIEPCMSFPDNVSDMPTERYTTSTGRTSAQPSSFFTCCTNC